MFFTNFRSQLLAFLGLKFITAGRIKDRAAAVDGIGHADAVHIHDLFLQQSGITSHDALYLHPLIDRRSHNAADRRIHSRRIAAAGKHANGFYLFFRHIRSSTIASCIPSRFRHIPRPIHFILIHFPSLFNGFFQDFDIIFTKLSICTIFQKSYRKFFVESDLISSLTWLPRERIIGAKGGV